MAKIIAMATTKFADFIEACTTRFTPVIDVKFKKQDFVHIDLSETNKEVREMEIPSASLVKKFIEGYVTQARAKIAYGGYNEKRNLYRRSVIFNNNEEASQRDIHIGLDIWCNAGTSVLAALDGTVHSFQDNEGFGNYGPTIILEHNIDERTFYTLYGHLSKQSIANLSFGQIVEAGDKIGTLGSPKVNGDYAPHLHFQIMEDLQGNSGDYPGVAAKADLEYYLNNCPDPNLLLKI
ncbi:peptidoglycan DD-metalloendopeptidase family protein [Gillisia sp. M10.2A]|uniref:Peptidoglycan DD-metalloendopeptidase family protein n=1 Tax=Gillisia lutea TaxID=2909668 RepID=A0ABS9EGV5_9FLAO|nr:peptidoglycan DD-metalloendopeptidase family protein [Gillisia lutea]MCF4102100.1 peptidoglycan DD-metalloendopeptidase family protein [Gillisia lutea]